MAAGEPEPRVARLLVTGAPEEGRGHIARALALAEGLREQAFAIELVLLRGALTEQEDARATVLGVVVPPGAVGGGRPSVVIVDLPDPNESTGLTVGSHVVVFDDQEWFTGNADIVVQPSFPTWAGKAGAGRVLAGYAFIPIASRIREAAAGNAAAAHQAGTTAEVLVCFGGSDPHRVTERLASALVDGPWRPTFVVGAGYAGPTLDWPVAPIRDPADLADRMARCDIAVLGAGTMKFEAACLGRPTILVGAADDQLLIGEAYARTGAARWVGDGRTIDPSAVRDAVAGLLRDEAARRTMAGRARALVDGRGALRLAEAIAGLPALDVALPG